MTLWSRLRKKTTPFIEKRDEDGKKKKGRDQLPDVCNDVGECPALQVLHNDPQLVLHQIAVVHLHDVRVVVVTHDDNLGCKELVLKHVYNIITFQLSFS